MWIDIVKKKLIPFLLMVSVLTAGFPDFTNASAENLITELAADSITGSAISYSEEWEDYIGDLETFVYGLIIKELGLQYDTFPASTELLDGSSVYGIAYTDYAECYTSEDSSEKCFFAGFIPFCGELQIPQEDFDTGLSLTNLDYTDENTSFTMAYGSEAFANHCVVYGKYLQYGVDENGQLFFDSEKYTRGQCEQNLGSLYSYDEGKYVYIEDVGHYKGVTGSSLASQIDFDELEQQISQILQDQDNNFVTVDVESCAYIAQEAISSYLFSLQEETFLGYRVSDLIEATNNLDPLECCRITADGIEINSLEYDGGASATAKWLVGTACVIVTAVATVGAFVTIECPPLSALSGALAGSAIDLFMQVVSNGETLNHVEWNKVAISAATGAVAGYLGPYINATYKGVQLFCVDSSLDAIIGGIEYSALAWMEGENAQTVIQQFGYGAALGFALSGSFKAVGGIVQKLASKIDSSEIYQISKKISPKLTRRVSRISGKTHEIIYGMKRAVDSSALHSEYISDKIILNQLERLETEGSQKLAKKSFKHLDEAGILDVDGNTITKKDLLPAFTAANDGDVIGFYNLGGEKISIVKKNGMVGIVFDTKYQTVLLPNGITTLRSDNFEAAAEQLKKRWLDNDSLIPDSLKEAIRQTGKDLEDLSPKKIVSIIQGSDWVLHENIDKVSISLVPRAIHEEIRHMGGVGLAKFIKSHMGFEFFERFVTAASTGSVQAVA